LIEWWRRLLEDEVEEEEEESKTSLLAYNDDEEPTVHGKPAVCVVLSHFLSYSSPLYYLICRGNHHASHLPNI